VTSAQTRSSRRSALSRPEVRRRLAWPLRIATFVALIAAWEAAARGLDSKLLLPGPALVLEAAVDQITNLAVPTAVVQSLLRLLGGMALAASTGISLGVAAALFPRFAQLVGPLVRIVYVVPTVAVLPLVIVWFGIFEPARIVLIAYACFFEFYTFTRLGVERAYEQYHEPAQSMGAGRWALITRVLLPGALPYLSTGVRLATSQAIVGLVLAEFFTAVRSERDGVGALILTFGSKMDTAEVFVGILALIAMSLTLLAVLRALENWFARWHMATRAGG
jgi:ABC-type nitrate/sulfonate/bicarbonate transport system permease component